MADGARWARDHGATIIDINMGCPVDKVTKKDGGSKLLCDPTRAAEVVKSVVAAVGTGPGSVPVTVKMRLGWFDPPHPPVAESLAPRLVEAGVAAITIHGRTTEQKFSGEASLEGIARVVQAVRRAGGNAVPVIGNGDIKEAADVVRMIRLTGCDGVMIGRGALSTPWIFRDAWSLQTTGTIPAEPDEAEKIGLIRRYFRTMLEYRAEHYAMFQMRRRISWFAKRLGPCRPLREAVRLARTPSEIEDALDAFLAGGLRSFASTDRHLEEEAQLAGV
jgi:nifR3 family TIM-barrel protein